MNLFGKKAAKQQAPDPTQTILKLRETLDTLDKREIHIQKKIKAQLIDAKQKSVAKDKRGALFALKRKKMYEGEINKINGARMTLESQIIALESSNMNMQTFRAMQSGAQAMQQARGRLDVDQVDDVMDDIKEEMDIADQIGEAIARPADDLFDDDELLQELEMMEEQDLEEQLLQAPSLPAQKRREEQKVDFPAVPTESAREYPAVPTSAVQVSGGEAEDEDMRALRELEASMAM